MASRQLPPKKDPRPVGRRSLLTPDTHSAICIAIEKGAYDYIAALAAGISQRTFLLWMEKGEAVAESLEDGEESEDIYFVFYCDVRQARAKARLKAEAIVYESDAFKWLRYGPGREKPGEPGWTDAVQVTGDAEMPLVIKTEWGLPASSRQDAEPSASDLDDDDPEE